MARRGERGRGQKGEEMKRRIIAAALETLKREGFNGASARTIARTGGFNAALIFYHFGSVNELLLAALDETSRTRIDRYRELLGDAKALPEVMQLAAQLYREDLESGHITVVAQMLAGASAFPELGPQIVERVQPWVRFTEEVLSKVLTNTPLGQAVPVEQVVFGIVSLYLGMELLTHLEGPSRADSLFALAENAITLFGQIFGSSL